MARKRFRVFDYVHILEELRAHASARELQRKGIASRNTVAEIIAATEPLGWLDRTNPMPSADEVREVLARPEPVPFRPSTVEPHREKVEELAAAGWAPLQIFRHLKRETSFNGSVGAVKRFLKHVRKSDPEGYVTLVFEPGEAAQVDFGSGPELVSPRTGKPVRTHVFVMTLCDSRHMYAEVVWDQKVETWQRCHRNAFEFFGGVPNQVILDNLKAAILRACHREPEVQKSYETFAQSWGFQIKPCKPRTPRHKGRVERGVGYVKNGFLALRTFRNLQDANQQLVEWILGEAGNRIHGTTHEVPLTAFAEREKGALQKLPSPIPEMSTWSLAKLHPSCRLTFDKAFYTAPYRLIGQKLHVRATDRVVEIHQEGRLIALHVRADRPGQLCSNDEHYPPEKVAHMMKTPQWCLRRAQDVGPNCLALIQRLLGNRVVARLPAAQGILSLGERYGRVRLETACARALAHEVIEWKAVRSILEKGLDQVPDLPDNTGQMHFSFPETPRFSRDIGKLLAGS